MTKLRRLTETPLILIVVTIVASTLTSGLGDASLRRIVIGAVVNMIAVIGIYVFVGLTGVFSFGQLGFMAVGAYATAVLTVPVVSKSALFSEMPEWMVQLHLPSLLGVLVGGIIAALMALIISVPMSRMSGLTASLATLAILVAVYVVAGNWRAVTNGSRGVMAIPTDTTLPIALAAVTIVIIGVWLFQESALGLKIRATREDAVAARAIGINVGLTRGIAFVVSGFIMGIAGGLYAQLQGSLAPDAFFLGPTFLLVAMLVVGGMTSLTGAVVGTLVITVVRRPAPGDRSGLRDRRDRDPGPPGHDGGRAGRHAPADPRLPVARPHRRAEISLSWLSPRFGRRREEPSVVEKREEISA